ncbi:MAG: hypothetical protein L0241_02425 [Planctomycetia bacterium]|nr:hypothetical protein [Planctomycetia bacterium]
MRSQVILLGMVVLLLILSLFVALLYRPEFVKDILFVLVIVVIGSRQER